MIWDEWLDVRLVRVRQVLWPLLDFVSFLNGGQGLTEDEIFGA